MKYLKKFNEGYYDTIDISDMLGKKIQHIEVESDKTKVVFYCYDTDGSEVCYTMYHEQDCCEYVYLEDITGDLEDLYAGSILKAEETTNRDDSDKYESATWTFYNLATSSGYVQFRWLGTSNGYYSEAISISKTKPWYN